MSTLANSHAYRFLNVGSGYDSNYFLLQSTTASNTQLTSRVAPATPVQSLVVLVILIVPLPLLVLFNKLRTFEGGSVLLLACALWAPLAFTF